MKKKLFINLMLAMVAMLGGLSLTGCGDEDYLDGQLYTYGFEEVSASGSDFNFLTEMSEIEAAFESALGSPSPMPMSGSSKECDAKVKAACEKAAASLEGRTWSFNGLFQVTNETTETVVYSLRITKG